MSHSSPPAAPGAPQASGAVSMCLRLDDVHGLTPLKVLRELDAQVWAGRPVVLGTIPFPARGCLGPVAALRETHGHRSTLRNSELVDYLDERRARGAAEVALHGLTHADHRSPAGPAAAELVFPSSERSDRLMTCLKTWRARFGTRTLVAPHNYIAPELTDRLLAGGYNVSRAVTRREVTALGLDPAAADARGEAKRRRPFRLVGDAVDLYQTAGIDHGRVQRSGLKAELLAASVMEIAAPAGVGVLTFHWWDFLTPEGAWRRDFATFVADVFRHCESLAPVRYTTVAGLADTLGDFTAPTGPARPLAAVPLSGGAA
ncbi:DUF2334 domain-containing protein [Streptomyces sp. NPDC059474]|uniref:DUF2334 domain-containing protein n=3 Tax=unclassified Streptomyces TaxID=2593676 RepID=UPI003699959F